MNNGKISHGSTMPRKKYSASIGFKPTVDGNLGEKAFLLANQNEFFNTTQL